jgi:hypothetical protein
MNLSPGALILPNLSRREHIRSSANGNECVSGKLFPLSMHACKQILQVNDNVTHRKFLVDWALAADCTAGIPSYCVVS